MNALRTPVANDIVYTVGCLSDETAMSFVEKGLRSSERTLVGKHIDDCENCRRLISELIRSFADSPPSMNGPAGVDANDANYVGRYIVRDVIGCGAMGMVYAAYDPELARTVALKVMLASDDGDPDGSARLRLQREAQAMARLSHPNVVTVYDVGTVRDRVFVAMELVEGRTLAGWMRERQRSWQEVVDIFVLAGGGLAAAHGAGLVHRDFKPDNVLVGRDGRVRVADFGLARGIAFPVEPGSSSEPELRQSLRLTRSGVLAGTPAYMAPEQFRREPIDHRTDQFSFCVALYEALCGERPFQGSSLEELASNVCSGRIVASRGTSVPEPVMRVVLRGLRRDPAERHPAIDRLLAELERARASAVPDRRWRRVLSVAAAVLATTGAVATVRAYRVPPVTAGDVGRAASGATAITLLTLPPPSACKQAAVIEHAAGMRLLRDSNWNRAMHHFEKAVELDPECADARFRRALVGRFEYPSDIARAAYQSAVESREKLTPRDAQLLAAYERILAHDPPDKVELSERVVALADANPRDAELSNMAALELSDLDPARAESSSRKALRLDPEYADAWQMLARTLMLQGKTSEALEALDRCVATVPSSTDCILEQINALRRTGQCDRIAGTAQTWIARDPDASDSYFMLTIGLVSQGHQTAASEALRQRWQYLPEHARNGTRLRETALVASRFGDFTAASQAASELGQVVTAETDLVAHVHHAMLAIELAIETGAREHAKRVANDLMEHLPVWSRIVRDYPNPVMFRFEPWFAATRYELGMLSRTDLDREMSKWRGGHADRHSATIRWSLSTALPVRDAADAHRAIEAATAGTLRVADEGGAIVNGATGRALLLAGRAADSVPYLRAATQSCSGFEQPFSETRAYLWLGKALEEAHDADAACTAYRVVLERWGQTKPASVTAGEARRRSSALACDR